MRTMTLPSVATSRHFRTPPAAPFLRSIAARLALVQACIMIGTLGLVAYFGHLAQLKVARHVIESRVLGEVASLKDELDSKGSAHLPHTVDKRSRIWRGFEYRLVGADGTLKAGRLPSVSVDSGWSVVTDASEGDPRQIVTYSEPLSDGSFLSVGQDLSAEARQTAILTNILLWSGAFGISLGFGVSFLFVASGWRRISALGRAARDASTGRLDVRVETRTHGLRDDVDELGQVFNTMLIEISDLMNQIQQVSTAVAHDLRTPLTRVRQRVERLAHKVSDTPELSEAVGQVDAELEELSRTFDAMLRLAEIENARDFHGSPVDVEDIIARVADAYRPEIEDSGRSFRVRTECIAIQGDGQLISQAIANLLDNAVRHTPEGTAIELGVEQRPCGVVLSVVDRGPGIPQDQRPVVLERFRKLDPSRHGPGCGLGLAIVAAIARHHGATLMLMDAAPGLRVEIRFPPADALPH